jgi:hypothetical protein
MIPIDLHTNMKNKHNKKSIHSEEHRLDNVEQRRQSKYDNNRERLDQKTTISLSE